MSESSQSQSPTQSQFSDPLGSPLRGEIETEEHWVAVSDLMGGLMMVFLLIAVIYMVQLEIETRKIKDVALLYDRLRTQLYEDLYDEFQDDLPHWGAEINRDLSVRFYNTEVLFAHGDDKIKPAFREILNDFFPRYVKIITSSKYRDDIIEIRIEGHTSSDWGTATDTDVAYIKNMALSQSRTRTTLAYLLDLDDVNGNKLWLKEHLTANGLSSSKLVISGGVEDGIRSRRVEFRLRTDAESRIAEILKEF
jgi:outer membrane protein OmpA-like peptidoglycan-associated protein